MPNPINEYILCRIWVGWFLFCFFVFCFVFFTYQSLLVVSCQIFFKYSLNLKYTGFVGFYGISTMVGYLLLDLHYTHTHTHTHIHIYIYIYIWFDLVGVYSISTILSHLKPNALYTFTSNIHDLVGFGFMPYQLL